MFVVLFLSYQYLWLVNIAIVTSTAALSCLNVMLKQNRSLTSNSFYIFLRSISVQQHICSSIKINLELLCTIQNEINLNRHLVSILYVYRAKWRNKKSRESFGERPRLRRNVCRWIECPWVNKSVYLLYMCTQFGDPPFQQCPLHLFCYQFVLFFLLLFLSFVCFHHKMWFSSLSRNTIIRMHNMKSFIILYVQICFVAHINVFGVVVNIHQN